MYWAIDFYPGLLEKCNLPGFGGPAVVTGLWMDFTPVRLNLLLSIKVNLMTQTQCVA